MKQRILFVAILFYSMLQHVPLRAEEPTESAPKGVIFNNNPEITIIINILAQSATVTIKP